MQVSEDKMDALVNDCLKITEGKKHPFSKDSHVWTDMEAVVNLVLERAQADARPVAYQYLYTWHDGSDVWRSDAGSWNGQKPKASRALYTHPEASAPGVSDDEITDVWIKHGGPLNGNNFHSFARAILTRASATTVSLHVEGEHFVHGTPEATALAQAKFYKADAATVGEAGREKIDNALYCLRNGDTESVENYLIELRGESPTCGDCGGDPIAGTHNADCEAAQRQAEPTIKEPLNVGQQAEPSYKRSADDAIRRVVDLQGNWHVIGKDARETSRLWQQLRQIEGFLGSLSRGDFTVQQATDAHAIPHAKWEDPRVQQVYEILCRNDDSPADEHWEGFQARLIVDALFGDKTEMRDGPWTNERCQYEVCDEDEVHDPRCTAWKEAGSLIGDGFVLEFERWNDVTGALPRNGSWLAEVSDIIQRAAQSGQRTGVAEDAAKAVRFAGMVFKAHRNDGYPGDVDGDELQRVAIECGFLDERTVTESCGANCSCADVGEFPAICYFNTQAAKDAMQFAAAPTQQQEGGNV